jgi:hypothetical protein
LKFHIKHVKQNDSFCHEKHFIVDGSTISEKHPDYDVLAPILMNLKLKARKLILQNYTDIEKVYEELFAIDFSQIGFIDYAKSLIAEMEVMAANEKFDLKVPTKLLVILRCIIM